MPDFLESLSINVRTAVAICVFLIFQTAVIVGFSIDQSRRLSTVEQWINSEPIRSEARELRLRDLERESTADRVRFEHIMNVLNDIRDHTERSAR